MSDHNGTPLPTAIRCVHCGLTIAYTVTGSGADDTLLNRRIALHQAECPALDWDDAS